MKRTTFEIQINNKWCIEIILIRRKLLKKEAVNKINVKIIKIPCFPFRKHLEHVNEEFLRCIRSVRSLKDVSIHHAVSKIVYILKLLYSNRFQRFENEILLKAVMNKVKLMME